MQKIIEISHLSRQEKLIVMEDIWQELLKDETEVKSPSWHQDALQETKLRLDSGEETMLDWKLAKEELRNRFK